MWAKARRAYQYCAHGVWNDHRPLWWVKGIKALNLSVRAFIDGDIQGQACNMTYRTLLALVPAMALLMAVGRGFGLQDLIYSELYRHFPAQHQLIERGLSVVDSYLAQASEGALVGVGIVFLLYTLVALLYNVEEAFNRLWGVKRTRTLWQQVTDYTAILLILPVLVICSGGMSVLVSNAVTAVFQPSWVTPVTTLFIEGGSFVLMWAFFTLLFVLVPNTHVRVVPAIWCGLASAIGYDVLQWLFVTGQVYVARYNAIYGGLAFLPLFMIWLQLVWVVALTASAVCYSWQHSTLYSLGVRPSQVSPRDRRRMAVALMAVIVRGFEKEQKPPTASEVCERWHLPPRLVDDLVARLAAVGLLYHTMFDDGHTGLSPALAPCDITVGEVVKRLEDYPPSSEPGDLASDIGTTFPALSQTLRRLDDQAFKAASDIPVATLAPE